MAWAIAHLTERESVISHRDIVRHALEYGTGKATLAEVAAGIQEAKKDPSASTREGRSIHDDKGSRRGKRDHCSDAARAGKSASDCFAQRRAEKRPASIDSPPIKPTPRPSS